MSRVKRGVIHMKRRRSILKRAKGFLGRRRKLMTAAREALLKADSYAYRDRRNKKRDMRKLWTIRINAAVRKHGLSYSKFIFLLREKKVEVDRKALSELAIHEPKIFAEIVKSVK